MPRDAGLQVWLHFMQELCTASYHAKQRISTANPPCADAKANSTHFPLDRCTWTQFHIAIILQYDAALSSMMEY